MNNAAPKSGDAAVLWQRWRLLNGLQLYDLANDPSQDHDVSATHPDVVKTLQQRYDQWWAAIAPRVNEFSPIPIGAGMGKTTLLSPADWHDVTLDQQREVRNGVERRMRHGPSM